TGLDGVPWRSDPDFASLNSNRSGIDWVNAKDRPAQLGPAGSNQTGQADDLSGMQRKGNVGQLAGARQFLDPQHFPSRPQGAPLVKRNHLARPYIFNDSIRRQ